MGAACWFVFFRVPEIVVSTEDLAKADWLKSRNDVRTAGIQLLGFFAVAAGGLLTWRTIRLNREGQITDRYSQAIEHLGAEEPETRLGGIYALERIARDSRRDHWPIMELLVDYLRRHAPWPRPDTQTLAGRRAEIEAITTVLRRRRARYETRSQRLNLSGVDLKVARLAGANLEGAILSESNLAGAFLERARLRGAKLINTDLKAARLDGANLRDADARGANFAGAWLRKADLRNAKIEEATFNDARLGGAKGVEPLHAPLKAPRGK